MANNLQVLEPWNYEKSVETTKGLVSAYKKVSLDLVRELHAARQALSNAGYRTDKNRIAGTSNADLVSNETRLQPISTIKTFEDYLSEIGIAKATAFRWLALYIPSEDRLLTVEEAKERIEQRYQELRRQVVSHIGNDKWRPDGWVQAFESRYRKELHEADLSRIAMADEFDTTYIDDGGQIWLFDQPYLETLAERIGSYNADPRTYMRLCKTYEQETTKDVAIQKQVSIFQLTKAALEDVSEAARPEVARFVAELLIRDAAGTLKY